MENFTGAAVEFVDNCVIAIPEGLVYSVPSEGVRGLSFLKTYWRGERLLTAVASGS